MAGPYAGLRVFDLSHVIAGPFCTRLLADMGADVVRVEQPAGDLMRALPVPVGDPADHLSSAYAQYNGGKRSIGLDLKDPRGLDLALRLADWADVVVENFAPGVLARLGLGWDVLHARDATTILCSLSTFGTEGPYAHLSGFGLVAEAYSGLMSLTGEDGGPPMHFGTALADVNSAVHALAAIGAALHHRGNTGAGTHIDISAFDSLFAMIDQQPAAGAFTEGEAVGGKYGNRHTTSVPSGVATCADGTHLAYGMSGDVFFERLVIAMDAPDLRGRYATVRERVADPGPPYDRIEAWAATWPTADALVSHLVAQRFATTDTSSIRLLYYGAYDPSGIMDRTADALGAREGKVCFAHTYGLTEGGPFVTWCPPDDVFARWGSIGRPMPGVDVALLDDDGTEVAAGEPGEICVRGPRMSGYWRDEEASATALAGGWLHTGDVAVADADGFLTIVDRLKDMIRSGGQNVWSKEVEDCLAHHPGVADAAVIGLPDPVYEEQVVAVVVPIGEGSPALAEELTAYVRTYLAGYNTPRRVHFLAEFPRTAVGKIQKHVLRERFGT